MNDNQKNSISNKETKIKINSSQSRGSVISFSNSNPRRDVYGNLISKKIRNHKISFADEVVNQKELVEIISVCSYREYLKMEIPGKKTFLIFRF